MSQFSFGDEEYSGRKRITKREEFLKTMNEIIPWTEWVEKSARSIPPGTAVFLIAGAALALASGAILACRKRREED